MTTETAHPATRTPAHTLAASLSSSSSSRPIAVRSLSDKSGVRDVSSVTTDALPAGSGRTARNGRSAARNGGTGRAPAAGPTGPAGRTGTTRRAGRTEAPAAPAPALRAAVSGASAAPAGTSGPCEKSVPSEKSEACETFGSFDAFADDLFGHLPRTDQRRWAHAYLLALLTTEGKKSVRRLAAAVSDSPTASQSLHQFLNASPWDWNPVRRELVRRAEQPAAPRAWILAPAVLPKRGGHSVGVHRRFDSAAGRTVSCQLAMGMFLPVGEAATAAAVSVSAASGALGPGASGAAASGASGAAGDSGASAAGDCGGSAAVSVDWRLFLPPQWAEDPELLRRNRIPASETNHPRPMWVHALDLVEAQAARSTCAPAPVVADLSEYSDSVRLIEALARQGRDFVIAVPSATALATPATPGMPGDPGARPRLLQSAPTPVRLPGSHHTYRAFTEPGPAGVRPSRIWLTNMAHRRLGQLLGLARLHQLPTATLRTLATDFGLHDFEGRSFPGWHHHMTLTSAAHAYRALAEVPDEQTLTAVRFVS
ncbi:putative ISXo8 transposase [Streptomyces chrestomyceticus JCM 4735]|uniref:ISXo8 transposase n=1 Tax=Streptomyces chrestomyceticus JCM 4735 TaxID=1306181 RepID=A0A7U9KX41_9ACTN|nr:putative ISXo8 transposase [Streptomyces chrestomyceticus JCM 4735]